MATQDAYTIKYRQPGQIFWRRIRGVVGDGIDAVGRFRFFHTYKDTVVYVSLDAEVFFPAARQEAVTKEMSRVAGQNVQRA